MTERTRVLIYLLFTSVIVASCSEQPLPFEPAPVEPPPVQMVQSGCPSMADVCAEAKPIVTEACPPDSNYKSYADYNSCRREALKKVLAPYKRCFTGNERSEIRRCVSEPPQTVSPKGREEQFQEEPKTKGDSYR